MDKKNPIGVARTTRPNLNLDGVRATPFQKDVDVKGTGFVL
ncbi:MAG: hypothetical protein DKINENOH_05539 [bacterium]|nr:hypothetical protein [bacterium]